MAPRLTRGLSKPTAWILIGVGAFVINLPMAHSSWYEWRLDRNGVHTEATVVETRRVPPEGDNATYVVEFRFDRELDPTQEVWFATVDEDTWDRARADGRIGVRMLPDRPATQEVDGQDTSSLPWVITVLGDLMLLGVALLFWRAGPPTVAQLRLVATADVERCPPEPSLERLDDGSYVVCGEVAGIEDDAIVIDVGTHTVRVELGGHANPVGYQQPARVRGSARLGS